MTATTVRHLMLTSTGNGAWEILGVAAKYFVRTAKDAVIGCPVWNFSWRAFVNRTMGAGLHFSLEWCMPSPPLVNIALGLGSGLWFGQPAFALQVNASACCAGQWAGLLFSEITDLNLGCDGSVKWEHIWALCKEQPVFLKWGGRVGVDLLTEPEWRVDIYALHR